MQQDELLLQYRQLDKELAIFHYALAGGGKRSADLVDASLASKEEIEKKQKELLLRAQNLQTPDEVFAIWKDHFVDFAKAKTLNIDSYYKTPSAPLGAVLWGIENMFRRDSRDSQTKMEEYLNKIAQLPGVMESYFDRIEQLGVQAFAGIPATVEKWDKIWQIDLDLLRQNMADLKQDQMEKLQKGLNTLYEQMHGWKDRVLKLQAENKQNTLIVTEDDNATCPVNQEYYRDVILHDNMGVELDSLLSWYEEENEKTREEVFEIASKLPIPENNPKNMQEVNEILLKYAGPCNSVDEMFRRGREYLDRAQKVAREYVWLPPEEECGLTPVPESLKFTFPWGGYESGDGLRRPVYGQFFLNNHNYKAVTDGWIKMQAVHEAYPGHHVQYVRRVTDYLPKTADIGVKYLPMLEGTAHRSERAFEFIYPEDPFYPLFVAYRRHHTAVRIKAELMMHYFGYPIKDAVKLYMDELGFDLHTAKGQVKSQEQEPGYFTCYYYGMKRICDLQKQHKLDDKTFAEFLFSAGNVSLDTFARFLQLSEADKKRYYTLFCRMDRNPKETFGRIR